MDIYLFKQHCIESIVKENHGQSKEKRYRCTLDGENTTREKSLEREEKLYKREECNRINRYLNFGKRSYIYIYISTGCNFLISQNCDVD